MIRPQGSWLILTTWRRRTRRWAAWGRSRSPPSSWPVSSPSCCRRRWAEARWSARLRSATASRRPCWSGSAWVQQRQQSLVHQLTTCWLYTDFWFLLPCIYWTHSFLFTYNRTGQPRTFTILNLFFILSFYILCVQSFGQFVWSWSRALTVTTINCQHPVSWNKIQLQIKINALIPLGHFRNVILNLPTNTCNYLNNYI